MRRPFTRSIAQLTNATKSNRSFRTTALLPPRKLPEISAPLKARWWSDWIAATDTRQYLLKDPLNDWIEAHHGGTKSHGMSGIGSVHGGQSSVSGEVTDFEEFIMRKGIDFELRVMEQIKAKVGASNVLEMNHSKLVRSPISVQQTWQAMSDGVPIIHGGVLHHVPSRTYGITDLLVRSDWVSRIIDHPPVIPTLVATRLRDPEDPQSTPPYHYIVIDIKYSTLPFCADGIHLRNSGSFPAYKGQLYIYQRALNFIQGCTSHEAYVLGRGWTIDGKHKQSHTNPLNRLGTINYQAWDQSYPQRTEDALQWLRECRAPNAKQWNVTAPPLTRPELYPNMNNHHDYPYHATKAQLASQYHDITELWNVGIKHRQKAHDQFIYSWDHPLCTATQLGITSPKMSSILSAMLDINQSHTLTYRTGCAVLPRHITTRLNDWHVEDKIQFYVDFEVINHIMFDFDSEFSNQHASLIFTIGVGWICPEEKTWVYRHFTTHELSLVEEERICREFAFFIGDMSRRYNIQTPKCFHWASAEKTFWRQAMARHPIASRTWNPTWTWVDLMEVFKAEPIVVRGALGFSLKTIARAMHSAGLIQTTWPTHSMCKDGLSAMLCAVKSAEDAKRRGIPLISDALVQDILAYNEVDVRVLMEVLTYLRTHHLESQPVEAIVLDDEVPAGQTSSEILSSLIREAYTLKAKDVIYSPTLPTEFVSKRTRTGLFMTRPISNRTRSRIQAASYAIRHHWKTVASYLKI